VAVFGASAVMTSQDRERLDGLLAAVERGRREASLQPAPATSSFVEVAAGNDPFVLSGNHRNGSRSHS
jgi:hypothetical protein